MRGQFTRRAVRTNERFQQRVAREAIRAMQPGAGYFADSKKSGDLRSAIDSGQHTAALIMRCRHHRNRFLRYIDAEAETGVVDVRETLDQKTRRFVRDVEPDMIRAAAFH